MTKIPFYEITKVGGLTVEDLHAVDDMSKSEGWSVVSRTLAALMEPVSAVVYANTDPEKQLLLHQGLGAIYVAKNLEEFVSSAASEAERLLQQERAAAEAAEQAKESEV